MSPDPQQFPPAGRRERNKRDKMDRILAAARRLFIEQGFERTTQRQVAAAAEVSASTLLLYARTREELLMLLFLEELEPVLGQSYATLPDGTLGQQLRCHFRAVIDYHGDNPGLAGPFLRELAWISEPMSEDIKLRVRSWTDRLIALVEAACVRGELRPDADVRTFAICAQHLLLKQMALWIAGITTREAFEELFGRSLDLLLAGVLPSRP